jgi:hypothetical protein
VPDPPDLSNHLKLAETTFKTVLDADVHQDNKASRVLSAMAFLTAATAAVFGRAYPASVALPPLLLPGTSLDLRPITFVCYLILVLIGSALYLSALGPSLNIPPWLRARPGSRKVKSLLFFNAIASTDESSWQQLWARDSAELQRRMLESYIDESRLIAQKAQAKFVLMSLGSLSFRLALISLGVLAATLFSGERLVFSFALSACALICFVFAFTTWRRPPSKVRAGTIGWLATGVFALMALAGLMFS